MGRKKEKTDEEILQAARECFIKHGPAVATGVIARELGVSQATLFNRFHTKRELMFAALKPSSDNRFFEILDSPPDDRSVKDQLVEIGHEAFSYFTETDPRLAVLSAAGMTDEQLRECYTESPTVMSRRRLSNWLEIAKQNRRVRDVDTKSFATAYIGAVRCGASENVDIHSSSSSNGHTGNGAMDNGGQVSAAGSYGSNNGGGMNMNADAGAGADGQPAYGANGGRMTNHAEIAGNSTSVAPATLSTARVDSQDSDAFIENTVALFWPALDPSNNRAVN